MRSLNDQRHVAFAGHGHLLALPQRIVDGEGVDRDGQMLGVHLRKALAARVIPELIFCC